MKKLAKKTFIGRVVIRSKSEKVPDFGLGKGVLLEQEITFKDGQSYGFKSPLFACSLIGQERRLINEVVEVKWEEKKVKKVRKK